MDRSVPSFSDHLGVATEQPVLLELYAHWDELRGQRRFPRRQDLDPATMLGILGNLMVIAVECPTPGERPVFRYRLIGTSVTFAAGYDLTGSSFDDLPDPEFRDYCQALFEHAIRLAKPLSAAGQRWIAGEAWEFDSILLPLSEDGRTIDAFLAALVYPPDWNRGRQPQPSWNWHQN